MTDEQIVYGAEEHVGLLGQTRAGKTTFARKVILPVYPRLVVVDSKMPMRADGKTDFPDIPLVKPDQALAQASKIEGSFRWRMRWGVGPKAIDDMERFCYQWLSKAQRTALYFDEIADFVSPSSTPDGLLELIRKGGGLNLNVIWGAQRAQLVSRTFYVNTHHLHVFWIDLYDAESMRPYFPELKDRLGEIPYRSYRSLYRGLGGRVRLLGPVSA